MIVVQDPGTCAPRSIQLLVVGTGSPSLSVPSPPRPRTLLSDSAGAEISAVAVAAGAELLPAADPASDVSAGPGEQAPTHKIKAAQDLSKDAVCCSELKGGICMSFPWIVTVFLRDS